MLEHAYWRQNILAETQSHSAINRDNGFLSLKNRYAHNLDRTQRLLESLREGEPLDPNCVQTIVTELYEDRDNYRKTIHVLDLLSPLGGDPPDLNRHVPLHQDTHYCTQLLSIHCLNVALYSLVIAMWTRLRDDQKKSVLTAALLHDIGKAGITEKILNKPGKLNFHEFSVIQQHSCIGYDLACQAEFLDEIICDSILMHHERPDGKGYPSGLKENAIPVEAQIIAIADTFDAVTSDHVYKCRSTPFEALNIIKGMQGHRLDTWKTKDFLFHMTACYMDMSVLLNTGETGKIVFISPTAPSEPLLCVNQRLVDLSYERHIRVHALVQDV